MISLARRLHRPTIEGDEDSEVVGVATVVRDAGPTITTWIRDAQIILTGSMVVTKPGGGMATTQIHIVIKTDLRATPGMLRNRRDTTGLIEPGLFQAQQHTVLHRFPSHGCNGNPDISATVLS